MAEAVVSPIIEVLLGKLLTLAADEFRLVRHFKVNLEKLRESLEFVRNFLHDAEKKQVTHDSVKFWLRQLEDLAFDADNIIDEIDYEILSKQVKPTENKKVKSCFSSCWSISYRRKMGRRIKDINERLEKINNSSTIHGLESRLTKEQDVLDANWKFREENAFAVDEIFFGRGNEVSEIVKMLTSGAGQKSYVLPILGMGGLGKTTIAREVFRHDEIISHFGDENRFWVHASQNFDVRDILKNILKSKKTAEKCEHDDTQQVLLQTLQKHLGDKKFLLVLDDVWKTDLIPGKVWDDFVNSLSGICSASNGYCMIVTTRNEELAASIVTKTLPVHKLKVLPKDDCWSIIKEKAFGGGEIPFDVEEIGKNIAKKCLGLPLAAKVLGGLLSRKSKDEWNSIEKNWLSNPEDEKQISNVLKLSFDHLPLPSLKKCFAYCSIFPKGYEIEKKQLIELWMAEGFLQTSPQNGNNKKENMETIGSNNFDILLRNSLLQYVRSDDYGNVTHCNMHDLVHDLAYSILCEGGCKIRYVGYKPGGGGFVSIPKGQESYIRTLFFDGKISDIKFSDFESLHTLTLAGDDIVDLPTSIRELKHLRYLDISRTRVKCLSGSIAELYHLQTLRAYFVFDNVMELLPDSFKCLISLRHLHISRRTTLPPEIGKLTCLQTLPYIHVGDKKGYGISELGKLKDLKGELEICNLEKVREKNEAMSADLLQKQGIYKLKLVWGRFERGDEVNYESVLDGLQPHPDLKSLTIDGFNGKILPRWTSKMEVHLNGNFSWEALNNLMEIKLIDCRELEELPSLGQLRNLKSLELKGLTNVKSIRPSFYGIDNCAKDRVFPALKRLVLTDMKNLKEWDGAGDLPLQPSTDEVVLFPVLEHLTIKECKQLMRAPSHFPHLQKLEIFGMDSGSPLENICGMKLTTLTCLVINKIEELECLPDGLFFNNHNLSKVEIWNCPKMTHLLPLTLPGGSRAPSLRMLEIKACSSLRELSIRGCAGLTNLPIEMLESCALSLEKLKLHGLSSLTQNASEVIVRCLHKMTRLTSLYIYGVPKFSIISSDIRTVSSLKCLVMNPSHLSWNNVSFNETVDAMLLRFTSLRQLTLWGMEDWEFLPDGIQHLTSLQEFELWEFGGIEALPEWFGNLSSLERLCLINCKNLRHFPSEKDMQRLSKLTSLFILRCPLLLKEKSSNNYNNSEGPQVVDSEWPKISHIPDIEVDFSVIRS